MLLSVCSLLLLCPSALTQQPNASLLTAVPTDADGLIYCQNFGALRLRALQNDWIGLLSSSEGAPLLGELEREFRMQTHSQMSGIYAMADATRGESVFFVGDSLAGFLTQAPAEREALTNAMRSWLPEANVEGLRQAVQSGDAQIEIGAWPADGDSASPERIGHYAAFVNHPQMMGLFSAKDGETLLKGIETSLSNMGTDHRSALVQQFEAARESTPSTGGLEFFRDLSSLHDEAESMLKDAAEGMLPDPTGMLGLEANIWLHVVADVFPGRRVDCEAFLHIPKDTLAAKLADTFSALPATTPARTPKQLWSVAALQWDISSFYSQLHAAYIEQAGEEALASVDAGLEAAKAMTGVDVLEEVLGQLDGTFVVYSVESQRPPAAATADFMTYDEELDELGLTLGLKSGDMFLDAFERLIGSTGLESEFDLEEIESTDVYTIQFGSGGDLDNSADVDIDGGLAFPPHAFILGFARSTIERALRAENGDLNSSLLSDEVMLQAFNENQDACFIGCVSLKPLQLRHYRDLESPAAAEGTQAKPSADVFESFLTCSVRRTPNGFRFRVGTR
jgi:hypothetical protein